MSLSILISPPANTSQRVALDGRLDTHTCDQFDREVAPVLSSPIQSLVLDLARLEYISSAGIRSIFKARKALSSRGGKVLIANPQSQIQKVLDIVKAVPLNEIFSSNEEADRYLDAMQRKVLRGDSEED